MVSLRLVPPPRRTPPKPKYTEDRLIPGAFEGETVTRRRAMSLAVHAGGGIAVAAFTLPALGFAVGSAAVRAAAGRLGGRRRAGRLPGRHVHPEGHHDRAGHRRGRQDHRLHPRLQRGHRRRRRTRTSRAAATSSRCPRAACTSAARCASSQRLGALHLPVPRRRLRLHGQGRRRPAGAPARPLLHARAQAARSRSGRATRSTPSSSASRATAIRRRTLDGIGQYLYPGALLDAQDGLGDAEAAAATPPAAALPRPKRPGEAREGQAARPGQGGRDPRGRLDRRAHLAVRAPCGG